MQAIFCFNGLLNFFISKPVIAVDDRSADPFMFYFCPVGNLENDRESIFIFIWPQRAEFIGDLFRQHRVYTDRADKHLWPFHKQLCQECYRV